MNREADEPERLSELLLRLLGPQGFIRLCERFGGTRVYVRSGTLGGELVREIGEEAAHALAEIYGAAKLRVPLAREFRARHYRAANWSNADIARRLGITESAVDKLFNRMPAKPVKGSGDPRQLRLF